MPNESATLPNHVDERVIDACVELLDAGRPVSEILNEIKRLSAEGLRAADPSAPPTIAKDGAVASVTEERGEAQSSASQTAEPAQAEGNSQVETRPRAERKSRRIWPIAAVILLLVVTVGGTTVLRLFTPETSVTAGAQSSMPISTIAAGAKTAPNPQQQPLTASQIKALVDRGTALVGSGNLPAARLFYEPAVNAGNAQAAIYLGETYDPHFLKQGRFGKSARGDLGMAEYWFRRAQQLGSSEAQVRLIDLHR
ncbi:MAG: sel1 repeat family protein [Acidobacteriaceae bacterium]|nr:sel1 repeat family protein [Acidobacteriaceae bacterium]